MAVLGIPFVLPAHPTLRHPHTGEPLQAVGFRRSGTPIWPILGASPDDPPNEDPPAFEAITSQEELDRRLGARLAREREKFADYDDLKQAKADLDELRAAGQSEQEKAVAEARKEGEATARQASDARIIRAEAKAALATAQAKNPAAAVKLLDLTGITVGDDGEINADSLKAKIDALKTSDDYLFGDGTNPPLKPKPDHSQGGGGGTDTAGVDRGREMFASRRKKTT